MTAQDLLYVIAISRSGHHAIMKWMAAHYDAYEACNNVRPQRFDPGRRPAHANGTRLITVSFEDQDPAEVVMRTKSDLWRAQEERCFGRIDRRRFVVVLRDPYNQYASRLHANHGVSDGIAGLGSFVAAWMTVSAAFRAALGGLAFPLSYNHWFCSQTYRRAISAWLGRPFTDEKLNEVPAMGQSSFDGRKYDGQAQQSGVMTRWRVYRDHESMKDLLGDMFIARLAKSAFSDISDLQGVIPASELT